MKLAAIISTLLKNVMGGWWLLLAMFRAKELARLCFGMERVVTTVMITNSVDEAVLLADRILPMTRGPKATLGPGIAVDLPRPRDAASLAADPRALAIQAQVIEYLTDFRSPKPESPAREEVAA